MTVNICRLVVNLVGLDPKTLISRCEFGSMFQFILVVKQVYILENSPLMYFKLQLANSHCIYTFIHFFFPWHANYIPCCALLLSTPRLASHTFTVARSHCPPSLRLVCYSYSSIFYLSHLVTCGFNCGPHALGHMREDHSCYSHHTMKTKLRIFLVICYQNSGAHKMFFLFFFQLSVYNQGHGLLIDNEHS